MKILRVDSPLSSPELNVALMADSALRPDRRPLFLPPGEWECQIRMAVRIDRLGKAVRSKFASRYYSEYTPVNYLRPLGRQAWPDMADDALVSGAFRQIFDGREPVALDGAEGFLEFDREEFDRAFERLSAHTTFKTGDLIILPDAALSYCPVADRHVELIIGDSKALEFNIK